MIKEKGCSQGILFLFFAAKLKRVVFFTYLRLKLEIFLEFSSKNSIIDNESLQYAVERMKKT